MSIEWKISLNIQVLQLAETFLDWFIDWFIDNWFAALPYFPNKYRAVLLIQAMLIQKSC